jgi:hypothetical protein
MPAIVITTNVQPLRVHVWYRLAEWLRPGEA